MILLPEGRIEGFCPQSNLDDLSKIDPRVRRDMAAHLANVLIQKLVERQAHSRLKTFDEGTSERCTSVQLTKRGK